MHAVPGPTLRQRRPAVGWIYLVAFIVVGLSLSFLGPALTYLRGRAGVSTGEIGVLFAAQSFGYLLGSLLSGRLYDNGYGHRLMAFGLLGVAVAVLVIPHVTSVIALAFPMCAIGAFGSCIDVGGNTLVVWYSRGSGSSRLLNALHLFFGVGALLSPGLVDRSLAWTKGLGLAAFVLAGFAAVVAVLVLLHDAPTAFEAQMERTAPVRTPVPVLAVIGMFFFLYVGVEVGFSGWIKTYVEGLDLAGTRTPTLINTAFWVAFTVGRLLATVLAKRVRSGAMLFGSCALSAVLLLVLVAADGTATWVWITTVLLGFSLAPQFATMIAYAEEHISLDGRATSWFVAFAGLGGLLLPWLIGRLLDRSGSAAMPQTVLVTAVAVTAWLVIVRRELLAYGRTRGSGAADSMNAGISPPP